MAIEIDRDALAEAFLPEADENLNEMEETLVALEARPNDAKLVQTIFRMAHSLKGGAALLGLTGVIEFTHTLEDLLDRVRSKDIGVTSGLIDLLLRSVDVLREILPAAVAGDQELHAAHEAVLAKLRRVGRRGSKRDTDAAALDGADETGAPGALGETDRAATHHAASLRVGIDKLNRLLNLAGEILIDRGHARTLLETSVHKSRAERLETHRQADHLYADLQELAMKMRMVPLGPTFRQHIRTVRDLTAAQGKQARLVIEGADVEVDTAMIEHLKDPLTHMIRNAVDHGIEPPDRRTAQGKKSMGRVTLRAFHEAGTVVVQVTDDGAGLNRERILERARTLDGVADPESLSDQDLHQLLFESGFSTAQTVTEVSGRGVGMDVVRRNIEALRGTVGLESREGEGTTVTIRLPLTLAIIEGFSVKVMGDTYVIPMESVVECVELPAAQRQNGGGSGVIHLRGEPLPYVRLRELFRLEGSAPPREQVVIVKHGGRLAGLAVDELHGDGQTVIKPLDGLLKRATGIAASTILGDGRVGLIVDVPALMRETLEQATEG